MAGVWAKISRTIKRGTETIKNLLLLILKVPVYPVRKPFASLDEMKHDAAVSLRGAIGVDVSKRERKYDPPIEITKASRNLGVEISHEDKKIKFLVSRTLAGDISNLITEQLSEMGELNKNKENEYSSIAIFREENKVVIRIDVKEITRRVKDSPEHKGMSLEEVKKLVIKGIYSEVDRNLRDLAKITGGEFKVHTDQKLLYGVTEKLYQEYTNESLETAVPSYNKQQLSEVKPITESVNNKKSSEQLLGRTTAPKRLSSTLESLETSEVITQNNMTNPPEMYHVRAKKTTSKDVGLELPQHIESQVREVIGSKPKNFLRFEGSVYNDEIKEPLPTPFIKGQERRK